MLLIWPDAIKALGMSDGINDHHAGNVRKRADIRQELPNPGGERIAKFDDIRFVLERGEEEVELVAADLRAIYEYLGTIPCVEGDPGLPNPRPIGTRCK